MEKREALIELGRRIAPMMQEYGIESSMLFGYWKCDETIERFVAVDLKKNDAAQVDGLRPAIMFAMHWAPDVVAIDMHGRVSIRPPQPEGDTQQ